MRKIIALMLVFLLVSCGDTADGRPETREEKDKSTQTTMLETSASKEATTRSESEEKKVLGDIASYKGSGHVLASDVEIIAKNIYENGDRVAATAKAVCEDGAQFILPAATAYDDEGVPFARDLYNPYGTMYEKSDVASVSYENKDAFVIDEDGEVITAYVFANNYFEMYVNGIAVAKDAVPYTPYNSSIIKFKAKRPFNVAFHVVDWEEDLGFGREQNKGKEHMASEGGIVFTFKKGLYDIINISDDEYRVQTFYTAPVEDFTLVKESADFRDTSAIKLDLLSDDKVGYGIFWDMPADVFAPDFDDSKWQLATEYSVEDLNIDELPAYKNFRDVFDSSPLDARFIWTNNLYLDNDIVIRGIVE